MATAPNFPLVDADGHLLESIAAMAEYMDPGIRQIALKPTRNRRGVFPTGDGMHYRPPQEEAAVKGRALVRATDGQPGSPEDYGAFLDKTGIGQAVLYTSEGLSVGYINLADYAIRVCRAYNDYVADRYAKPDPRLHPMALLPMQDIGAAVQELRRAVRELGLVGAMLPSTGLPLHLAHDYYLPLYQEAADLGCALGVHGGVNRGIGLDSFTNYLASHVLHHPIPLMIALTGLIYHGILDRFPTLRVAFLEGGVGWLVCLYDRISRNDEIYGSGATARNFGDYLTSGQLLIGCEGTDRSLPYLIQTVGVEPFAYSTDYPHEVDLLDTQREIRETLAHPVFSDREKAAILGGNALRFYQL